MESLTNEYQFDVKEIKEGHELEIYRLHGKSLHKEKEVNGLNSLTDVFGYIRNYPLGPSCYIHGVFLERVNRKDSSLTSKEQSFVNNLSKWSKVRKIEILVEN